MQQLIQQRNVTLSLLNRAKILCNTWTEVQSKSLSTLHSICNIVSQQRSTLDLPKTVESHGVNQQSLVFKQADSIGNLIKKLRSIVDLLEDVQVSWSNLKNEVDRFMVKVLQKPEPTFQPLSTESMLQVVAVDPFDLYDMVGRLAHSYKQEYNYKLNLFNNLSTHLKSSKDAYGLLELWQADSHIDKKTIEQLSERIKLFNTVKKVLESVD